ncbi:MAG: hypothetical protein KDD65_14790 [Bacteroidetes bacterium]|nr:hypothetical protein [Bacteroidota bacterium]
MNNLDDSGEAYANRMIRIATTVRGACAAAAARGYEEARIAGLCHEGAVENAVCAVNQIDLAELVASVCTSDAPGMHQTKAK